MGFTPFPIKRPLLSHAQPACVGVFLRVTKNHKAKCRRVGLPVCETNGNLLGDTVRLIRAPRDRFVASPGLYTKGSQPSLYPRF